jgi:hypothetical protein
VDEGIDPYSAGSNFDAFLARLTECGTLRASYFGVQTMRFALEETISDTRTLASLANSAAMLIILEGQAL